MCAGYGLRLGARQRAIDRAAFTRFGVAQAADRVCLVQIFDKVREKLLGDLAERLAFLPTEYPQRTSDALLSARQDAFARNFTKLSQVESDCAPVFSALQAHDETVRSQPVDQANRTWMRKPQRTPQPLDRQTWDVPNHCQRSGGRPWFGRLFMGAMEHFVGERQGQGTHHVFEFRFFHDLIVYA